MTTNTSILNFQQAQDHVVIRALAIQDLLNEAQTPNNDFVPLLGGLNNALLMLAHAFIDTPKRSKEQLRRSLVRTTLPETEVLVDASMGHAGDLLARHAHESLQLIIGATPVHGKHDLPDLPDGAFDDYVDLHSTPQDEPGHWADCVILAQKAIADIRADIENRDYHHADDEFEADREQRERIETPVEDAETR